MYMPMNENQLDTYLHTYDPLEQVLLKSRELLTSEQTVDLSGFFHQIFQVLNRPEPVTSQQTGNDTVMTMEAQFLITRHSRFVEGGYHRHQFIECMYVYQGTCTQYIEDDAHPVVLEQNELCLLNPFVRHRIKAMGEGDILMNILIPVSFIDASFMKMIAENESMVQLFTQSFLKPDQGGTYCVFRAKDHVAIRQTMMALITEYYGQAKGYQSAIKGYLTVLMMQLMRIPEERVGKQGTSSSEHQMTKLLGYMEAHLADVSLRGLAETFYLNENYLSRLFREKTGLTFSELLMHLRLERAKYYLATTQMTVEALVGHLGYEHAGHFYRLFKQATGMTPGMYRKYHKGHHPIDERSHGAIDKEKE